MVSFQVVVYFALHLALTLPIILLGFDDCGGKIFSFGLVDFDRNGRDMEFSHSYVPVVFARILEEDEGAVCLALAALKKAIKLLFGFDLTVKGGLCSDHSQALVNSFQRMFPNEPRAQCFPVCSIQRRNVPMYRELYTHRH